MTTPTFSAGLVSLVRETVQQAVDKAMTNTAQTRFGTVTAVDPVLKRVTVDLSGQSVQGVFTVASYTPAVGDVVWLLQQGSTLVAFGKPADVAPVIDGGDPDDARVGLLDGGLIPGGNLTLDAGAP